MQVAQSGSPVVPPRIGRASPQPAHRAQRCWQAWHHGSPVALEISQGAWRPQIEQVIVLTGRQAGQSGPSGVRTLTGRRRPQPMQISWLAGSVIRQYGHSGWPCSSRVAASRTAPQREQGTARDLATQLRQSRSPSTAA